MGSHTLKHLTDEELVDLYYGEADPVLHAHLNDCGECRANLLRTEDLLNGLLAYSAPEPEQGFEAAVWAELAPRLSRTKKTNFLRFLKPVVLAPVMASVIVAAIGLVWFEQKRSENHPVYQNLTISPQAQARVLLNTLSDHLDRSQVLLSELTNAKPEINALDEVQGLARELADENRLLRLASSRTGDERYQSLLEDLERVWLSVANAPANASTQDFAALQRRIGEEGLLFKVRITDSDLRNQERKL